jgi:protein-tyrosine phosphatase
VTGRGADPGPRERAVPFSGATNFRDLGGYPTGDGHTTRWGVVYRSDGLHRLTPDDMARYRRLGIRTVYDLRGDAERSRYPDPFDSVHLPLLADSPAGTDAGPVPDLPPGRNRHETGPLPGLAADGERLLRDLYRGMLAGSAPLIGRLLVGLAEPGALPAVFHCTGGKDRTGITAAVLLELLGVDRETVLDDYELTARFRRREHQEESYRGLVAMGLRPEAAAAVLGAPRWVMADALDAIDQLGGAEAYVTSRAGVPAEAVGRLRTALRD